MLDIDSLKVGDTLPRREHLATNVSLFLYNAAVWNPHRIHYDKIYTTQVEQHPDIVIDGPLQGDWLSQVALNWLGDHGQLLSFEYANRRASYLGETLTSGGTIKSINTRNGEVELDLFVKNASGDTITPGNALVRIHQ